MGKRDRNKKGKGKKVSKGALKRKREQEAKLVAQKKEVEDRKRAEAVARGEDPDAPQEKKEEDSADYTMNVVDDSLNMKQWTRDIQIQNILIAPVGGGTPLIRNSDLRITHGQRYGLIGKNGAGKTTLLRHIESGSFVGFPAHLRVHLVQQEMEATDHTVLETVMASDHELTTLRKDKKEVLAKLDLPDCLVAEQRAKYKAENLPVLERRKKELKKALKQLQKAETAEEAKAQEEENKTEETAKATLQSQLKEVQGQILALNTCELPVTDALKKARNDADAVPPMRLAELDERLHYLDADQAESRASEVLDGLKFTDRMKNMKLSDLSGGWRMRVTLACGLFIEPDVLLLDEPTNHLDFPSVKWLTDYLSVYNPDKSLVIVSHERDFLNEVCTSVIHLDRSRLVYYKGNFDMFAQIRAELRRHQGKQYARQQREIAHQEDFIRRFAANKKLSTQAQSRRKLLNRMKRIEAVHMEQDWRFRFPNPEKLKNPLALDLEDMGFSYFGGTDKSKFLLRDVNCRVSFGKKVAVIGANGAGKSTLLKLIMNELSPLEGKCFMRNEVTHGYFAQHHVDSIDMDATPLQFLRHEYPDTSIQACFAKLGRFNIPANKSQEPIHNLSGGEKSRLAFAILTWYNPHFVIMDEPTNHLDLQTQDALVEALQEFTGSLLIVSHDRHLLTSVCNEFWVVGNQTVSVFQSFDKASHFCYKKCKPVDVLPREFSTVATKATKKIPDNFKKLNAEEILKGDTRKKNMMSVGEESDDLFAVDCERELQRGIDKGLTPNKTLVHLKGWIPKDGNKGPVNILGFDMMNKYFQNPEFADEDPFTFFENFLPLVKFVIPDDHQSNQFMLLTIVQSVWFTSKNDGQARATEEGALEMVFECLYQFGFVMDAALLRWKTSATDNQLVGRKEAIAELETWFDGLELQPEAEQQEEEEVEAEVMAETTI